MPRKSGTSMSSACPGCECTRQHLKIKVRPSRQGRRRSLSCIIQAADARRKAGRRPSAVSAAGHPSLWRVGMARRPGRIGQGPTWRLPPGRDENAYAASIRDTGQRPGAFPGDAISSSAYHVDLDADQPFHPFTYLAHRVGDLSACRDELGSRCVIGARPRRAREYPHIAVFWLPLGCVAAPLGLQGQFLVVPVLVAVEDGG